MYSNILNYFPLLLVISVLLFIGAGFIGIKNKNAALLFSLSLPGMLCWIIVLSSSPPTSLTAVFAIATAFPSSWVLPILTLSQIRGLFSEPRKMRLSTYLGALLVIGLYVLTAIVNRGSW